jgi:PadR family transcriptional regulator, regulatory protein PadR
MSQAAASSEVPYGTRDLLILKTLAALGPQHGYGIARRIEQVRAPSRW